MFPGYPSGRPAIVLLLVVRPGVRFCQDLFHVTRDISVLRGRILMMILLIMRVGIAETIFKVTGQS